ncbi:MAG: helix-turn-helix domain-containing protein [Candidatus Pacearchaeota archaeon]
MEDIESALIKFGLTDKEAKVYLAGLELGESTAYDIALKTHLPRTLIYDIFKRLIERGIASFTFKNKKKYFSVAEPEELIRSLKEKEKILRESLKVLKKLQKKRVELPKVKIFTGIEGVKTALEDILRQRVKKIYAYGSSGISLEIMPYYIQNWHMRRIKKKIRGKFIYNDTAETRKRLKKYPGTLKLIEYKFLPIKYASPTVFIIYNNKLIIIYWIEEPIAVIIESKEIVLNQKLYFEQLWKFSKKIKVKNFEVQE